jgi:acetylornithine deacetylase/succinyl-diaminopimelate desuccinylase-like protein
MADRRAAPGRQAVAELRAMLPDLLRRLVAIPSVSPLEGGDPAATVEAQELFADTARALGFHILLHRAPPPSVLDQDVTPLSVRHMDVSAQPSVVVARGYGGPRRIVINFHMDTVGPHLPPHLDGGVLRGRGAADAKGPGVAALLGAAAAFASTPWLEGTIEVRITSVPGEEGGAMGVYGTRWLTGLGHTGRLMIFAEPTGGRAMDTCTATMTLAIGVQGDDATDDYPADGHNATVGLGFLAAALAGRLAPVPGATVTIAGLHTGTAHNRVYGSGRLLVNIAYRDEAGGREMRRRAESVLADAAAEFRARYADNPVCARLAADWDRVVAAEWLKCGLPTLANRDAKMERLLAASGFPRHDPEADGPAFTCDAIWAGGGRPGERHVVVCGPGQLAANGAHTEREHIRLADLDDYLTKISRLLAGYGQLAREEQCALS